MILTVTCNPALDVTYEVDRLTPGQVHRVGEVRVVPGGKGVNVSRVLRQFGVATTATGLADENFTRVLKAEGVPIRFVPVLPAVRRTVVVQGDNETTSLWEPGPTAPEGAGEQLATTVEQLLPGAAALVVSGSLARGLDPLLPRRLAQLARDAALPCVLDLDDEPLRAAADCSGAVLVPNHEELRRLVGSRSNDVVGAALDLARQTGAPVVVTLGPEGMLGVADGQAWHATPLERLRGNPTGAGDAAAAGIACGLVEARPWPQVLSDAVAMSAAAVMAPVAGQIHLPTYHRWQGAVPVRRVQTLAIER